MDKSNEFAFICLERYGQNEELLVPMSQINDEQLAIMDSITGFSDFHLICYNSELLSHGSNFYIHSDMDCPTGLNKDQEDFLMKILKKELWEDYLVNEYPIKRSTNVVRFYKFQISC